MADGIAVRFVIMLMIVTLITAPIMLMIVTLITASIMLMIVTLISLYLR